MSGHNEVVERINTGISNDSELWKNEINPLTQNPTVAEGTRTNTIENESKKNEEHTGAEAGRLAWRGILYTSAAWAMRVT